MPHANSPLSELGRLRLARCVVEQGWSVRTAAERFHVSPTTAARWLHIYNHHRPHTALGGQPPASRVPNLTGQNT